MQFLIPGLPSFKEKQWGDHRVLIPIRPGWWDSHRVGLGAQPVETPEGWLIVYHGVREAASGSIYRVGLALLDLKEPWKLRFRSQEWVLGPSAPYEQMGDVPGVIFPSGAISNEETKILRLYYGAADKVVALTNSPQGYHYAKDIRFEIPCPMIGTGSKKDIFH